MTPKCKSPMTSKIIQVDVIVPVHNSSETIVETVESVMNQCIPEHLNFDDVYHGRSLDVVICCYDDGSSDDSWDKLVDILLQMKNRIDNTDDEKEGMNIRMSIGQGKEARGAGFARNRASELSKCVRSDKEAEFVEEQLICLLDSDDVMHPHRIAEQAAALMKLPNRQQTLTGCTFDRIPADATWHYTEWANTLSDERISLERFRELTLLQPTWMLTRSRYEELGGYIEAPMQVSDENLDVECNSLVTNKNNDPYRLVHPLYDDCKTLKLAEDLRFFYAHLYAGGFLHLHRTQYPLLSYRHNESSQSFRTPRKLLLQLRVKALEDLILSPQSSVFSDHQFVIWGAGRDGKDFYKALRPEFQSKVACFVDVDAQKIQHGFYEPPPPTKASSSNEKSIKKEKRRRRRIPIVHFSHLAVNIESRERLWEEFIETNFLTNTDFQFGRINKSKPTSIEAKNQNCDGRMNNNSSNGISQSESSQLEKPTNKKRKLNQDDINEISKRFSVPMELKEILPKLPVVVCVAMYRTNGVLEQNVKNIGRTEGHDLWHFS